MAAKRNRYAPDHTLAEIIATEKLVIQHLYSVGFVDFGNVGNYTEHTVGGQAIQLGGRKRYILPGTNLRATVGRITTVLYRVEGEEVIFIERLPTLNTKKIIAKVEQLIRAC